MTEETTYGLGLVAEECGEVLQLIGKALRFGIDTPARLGADAAVSGETSRTLLPVEIGDLLAAIDWLQLARVVDNDKVERARASKLDRLLNPDARDNLGRLLAPCLSSVTCDTRATSEKHQ